MTTEGSNDAPLIGVLSLQGAFAEHQACLEAVGCRTIQIRTVKQLEESGLDGIVFPGGESTAMGLIGTSTATPDGKNMWDALKNFSNVQKKPVWGTCAGMILLAEKCVGASAVIQDGQALIGGVDILVCRNYFGSQVSSFELPTSAPPGDEEDNEPYNGVFIRAPAILTAGPGVSVLGKVVATPCHQAAATLCELERKLENDEDVVQIKIVDALERKSEQDIKYKTVVNDRQEEKKEQLSDTLIELPGAADGTNAREVISAVRKDNILCTAFHPELTSDYRWHKYFATMVQELKGN